MSISRLLIPIILAISAATAFGQDLLKSQPPLWSTKPDIATFETSENDKLSAAERSIEAIVAVKGKHNIENTLAPYDEAVREIKDADNIAELIQQVHPDAAFRDYATNFLGRPQNMKAFEQWMNQEFQPVVTR